MGSHQVGDFEVAPLFDGLLAASIDKIPDPAHRAEAARLAADAGPDPFVMNVFAFLLRGRGRTMLIDAGSGRLKGPKMGKLPQALAAQGLEPRDIDAVLMTHLHGDHYGGLVADGRAAFPRAELVIPAAEAAFWLDGPAAALPVRAQASVEEARAIVGLYAGRIRRVEGEAFPGVAAAPAPGHTPGHAGWLVTSQSASLLAWGDVIHFAWMHLAAPQIAMIYDADPDMALASRRRVLDQVAAERIVVAGAHLPDSGLGRIARTGGDAYAFEPIRLADARSG